MYRLSNQSINRSIIQSINQPIHRSINLSIIQSINQPIYQSINLYRLSNQSTSQSNQSGIYP
jgi:hypothetical protein